MKKQVSTLSLIALAAFSIWQYFTEHKKRHQTRPNNHTTAKSKCGQKDQRFWEL